MFLVMGITGKVGVQRQNIVGAPIVDGRVMQSGTTAEMVFSVPQLIAFMSRHVTLRPGDVMLTGTPDGVGIGRNPRIYMKPGASLTTLIEGLGSITTTSSTARNAGDRTREE